jgi:UDP:flavonoid glycosyltransferase YjiC (YdhE family)
VVVRQSVPHGQVFPLASAVVTHGGHGTVIRALAHGVPVVVIPFGRDQPANAARVTAKGVGLKVDLKADAARIRQAIQRVIDDPTFRNRARQVGQQIAEDAHSDAGVEVLEAAAAASPLYSVFV